MVRENLGLTQISFSQNRVMNIIQSLMLGFFRFGPFEYAVFNKSLGQNDAILDCQSILVTGDTNYGAKLGNLVSIRNAEENEFVRKLIGGSRAWIGARAFTTGTDIGWIDGSIVPYTNLAQGSPDQQTSVCIAMNLNGEWESESCSTPLPHVCKRHLSGM